MEPARLSHDHFDKLPIHERARRIRRAKVFARVGNSVADISAYCGVTPYLASILAIPEETIQKWVEEARREESEATTALTRKIREG